MVNVVVCLDTNCIVDCLGRLGDDSPFFPPLLPDFVGNITDTTEANASGKNILTDILK